MSYAMVISHVSKGLSAARPTTLDIPAGTFGQYYATDTRVLSIYSSDNGWTTNSSGSPLAVGAALTASAGVNATYLLDTAAGSVLTLPASTGKGTKITAIVGTSATSNAHKILTAPTTDLLVGRAVGMVAAGTTLSFSAVTGDAMHSIQMPFAGTQPSGGLEGDIFIFTDISAGRWQVEAMYKSGTTSTTPFSTSTT